MRARGWVMDENAWRITIAVFSALGGGGFAAWLVRGAMREDFRSVFFAKDGGLTEAMRGVFLAKGEGVTHAELEEREAERTTHFEQTIDKSEARIRTAFESAIHGLNNSLTRDNAHLQQRMEGIGKGVDLALKQSTESDRRSLETAGEMNTMKARMDGIEKNLDTRLKHMESLLDLLARRAS